MYFEDQQLVYSPSDLTVFLDSSFASWMERLSKQCPQQAPAHDDEDELNKLLQQRGYQHEDNLLAEFRAKGLDVVEIPEELDGQKLSFAWRHQLTLEAMQCGAEVIFQGALELAPFRGYSDFLLKVPGASKLGDYHYEVWDTKLASKVKPYFVVQLCCYAEMLERLQGVKPKHLVVALGSGEQETLKTEDYYYYYLALKARFLGEQAEFDPNKMPDPADSKSHGCWSDFAATLLEERDHLSLIANITRSQVKKLNKAGIHSCQQLLDIEPSYIPGLNQQTLKTLRAQAGIQKASAGQIPPLFKVKPLEQGKKMGLALLPPHSDLDVFFDIEGFPWMRAGWSICGATPILMSKVSANLSIFGRTIVSRRSRPLPTSFAGCISVGSVIRICISTTMPIMRLLLVAS